jgi:hypothetical protein
MKRKWINILNGIADGMLPNIGNSIRRTKTGKTFNRPRLVASVLSWITLIAMLKGWLTTEQLIEIIRIIFSQT